MLLTLCVFLCDQIVTLQLRVNLTSKMRVRSVFFHRVFTEFLTEAVENKKALHFFSVVQRPRQGLVFDCPAGHVVALVLSLSVTAFTASESDTKTVNSE